MGYQEQPKGGSRPDAANKTYAVMNAKVSGEYRRGAAQTASVNTAHQGSRKK